MQAQLQQKKTNTGNNTFVPNKAKSNNFIKSSSLFIQPKLNIRPANDAYEKEADAIADAVVKNPISKATPAQKSKVTIQRKCNSCEKEKEIQKKPIAATITPIQRKAKNTTKNNSASQSTFEKKLSTSKGSGHKMDAKTQSSMERGFGTNFNAVRIHTDTNAVQMNKAIHAQAFTNGNDIYFNTGQYNPNSKSGRHLLAHELTHTIQQRTTSAIMPKTIQRYTNFSAAEQKQGASNGWIHPQGNDIRIADDGKLAVEAFSQYAWATEAKISQGEEALKANYSDVKMEKGSTTIEGFATKTGDKVKLHEVKLLNRKDGANAKLVDDCGTTARQILGLNAKTDKFCALHETHQGKTATSSRGYGEKGNFYTTTHFMNDILNYHFGTNNPPKSLPTAYMNMDDFEKNEFHKEIGINEYAVPELGQAITINEPPHRDSKVFYWNFHFAGVLLKSAADYITAENYPGTGGSSSWYFSMYGTKQKKQTFHGYWAKHGREQTMTMVIDVPSITRIPILLKKAIANENGEDILKIFQTGKQNGFTVDNFASSVITKKINLVEVLDATSAKQLTPLLNYLKKNYFSLMTLKDRKTLVIDAASGHTSTVEEKLISAIMHSGTTAEYTEIAAHVEKEVSNESDDIIVESLRNEKGKLTKDNVPNNLSANQAQELINILLSGATTGDDEPAILMILESLNTTTFKKVVTTITPDKLDSGLDGYYWDKFLAVTAIRYGNSENLGVQLIHKEKNDDASRLLVYMIPDKNDISPTDWIKIIEALLSGSTGDDDENAILKIVKHLKDINQHHLVHEKIGASTMDGGVDGTQWEEMVLLMKKFAWN